MKMEDIRAKSQDELKDMILSSKRELFNLRFQQAASESFNTNRFGELRRDIARAKTALTQKINGEPVKVAKKPAKAKAAKKTNA
jgi:large subunit ribosomal protein L29